MFSSPSDDVRRLAAQVLSILFARHRPLQSNPIQTLLNELSSPNQVKIFFGGLIHYINYSLYQRLWYKPARIIFLLYLEKCKDLYEVAFLESICFCQVSICISWSHFIFSLQHELYKDGKIYCIGYTISRYFELLQCGHAEINLDVNSLVRPTSEFTSRLNFFNVGTLRSTLM